MASAKKRAEQAAAGATPPAAMPEPDGLKEAAVADAEGAAESPGRLPPLPEGAYGPDSTPLRPSSAPQMRTYRVWTHGDLQRNGVLYKAGDIVELPESVGSAIPCLEPAD